MSLDYVIYRGVHLTSIHTEKTIFQQNSKEYPRVKITMDSRLSCIFMIVILVAVTNVVSLDIEGEGRECGVDDVCPEGLNCELYGLGTKLTCQLPGIEYVDPNATANTITCPVSTGMTHKSTAVKCPARCVVDRCTISNDDYGHPKILCVVPEF